jgi:hypothetical protein
MKALRGPKTLRRVQCIQCFQWVSGSEAVKLWVGYHGQGVEGDTAVVGGVGVGDGEK